MKNSRIVKLIGIGILVIGMLGSVFGQNPSRSTEKGIVPGIPYASSDVESVNLTNGNLNFSFPLGNLPSGRGSVSAGLYLKYNSKLWKTHIENIPNEIGQVSQQSFLSENFDSGWKYGEIYGLRVSKRNDGLDKPVPLCNVSQGGVSGNVDAIYTWKVQIEFPDGNMREFRPTGRWIPGAVSGSYYNVSPTGLTLNFGSGCSIVETQNPSPFMTYYSADGSFMRLIVYPNMEWELFGNDGTRITQTESEGQRIYDKNGNYFKFGVVTLPDGSSANGWIDQFDRFTARKGDTIYQKGFDGQLLEWKVRWKEVTVMKKYRTECFGCGNTRGETSFQVLHTTLRVVDNIQTPNGLTNSFEYNALNGTVEWDPAGGTTNQNWSPGWGEIKSFTQSSDAKSEFKFKIDRFAFLGDDLTPSKILEYSGRVVEKKLTYSEQYEGNLFSKVSIWAYIISDTASSVTNPDGSSSSQLFYHVNNDIDLGGHVYKESSSTGAITEKLWKFNLPTGFNAGRKSNPYVKAEFTTIPDANGNPLYTAIKDFSYDKNGNITQVKEYDFVSYYSIPRDGNGRVTAVPGGISPVRTTNTDYYSQTQDASFESQTVNVPNGYWNITNTFVKNAVASTEVKDSNNQTVSRSEFFYDNPATTANPIETKIWDSYKNGTYQAYSNPLTASNSISSTVQYDQYGNPTLATDAKGTQTQITYGAINGYTGLYPTEVKSAFGTAIEQTAQTEYDFSTGLPKKVTAFGNTAAENVVSETEYDAIGRPIKTKAAVGTASEIWSTMEYDDIARRVISRSDIATKGDGKKISIQHFDQLGRVRLTRSIENSATEDPYNEAHGIKVQTRYETGNPHSYSLSSNPYRAATASQATNEESMGWTRNKAINTGKHSETETFAGANLPAPWGTNTNSTGKVQTDIDGERTLVTDQSGKQRISKTNALGQLLNVWEVKETDADTEAIAFGNLSLNGLKTSYQYDTLNNLKQVNQGVQTRSFAYSSLSRLLSANNPESGLISYKYDESGNLTSKTDARSITTTYIYDVLNRVKNRNYSDNTTPNVAYTYDNGTNAKGKLTKVTNGISTTEYTNFDILGRVKNHSQTTDGNAYNSSYVYNLSGALIEETYPSGRVVKNTLDIDGDLALVQSSKSNVQGLKMYANAFTYTSAGAVSSLRLANGKFENTTFNSRLQPIQIGLGASATSQNLLKLNFDYGLADNNGNVKSQTITTPTVGNVAGFTATQNYTYDSLNRLKSAVETIPNQTGWKQTFKYDRYGNREFDTTNNNTTTLANGCPIAICNPTANPQDNKLVGTNYDSVGNTSQDANGQTFVYDAENKQTKVVNAQGVTLGEYFHDGDGKRIKKIVPSTNETTIFVYDASGKTVAEYSTIVANQADAKISYLTNDHLGSPRITTDSFGKVVSRRDFMPYGEEIQRANYGSDSIREKFATYERDTETELDFAQARYYNKNLGRFNSADPYNIIFAMGSAKNSRKAYLRFTLQPQNWNKYSYVLNKPLSLVDPKGLTACDPSTDPNCKNDNPPIPKECVGCTWSTDANGKPVVVGQDGKPWLPQLPEETVTVASDGAGVPLGGGNSRPNWFQRNLPWIFGTGVAAAGVVTTAATIKATNAAIVSGLGITNGMVVTEDASLVLAEQFLGGGYTEDSDTPGRYISGDGTRVVRMTDGDLTGHGGRDNAHMNFETLVPNAKKPGKMKVDKNLHVYLNCGCAPQLNP